MTSRAWEITIIKRPSFDSLEPMIFTGSKTTSILVHEKWVRACLVTEPVVMSLISFDKACFTGRKARCILIVKIAFSTSEIAEMFASTFSDLIIPSQASGTTSIISIKELSAQAWEITELHVGQFESFNEICFAS